MSQPASTASVKSSFELALDKLCAQLSSEEKTTFGVTKREDLQVAIINIQNEQRLANKMVSLRRAQGFIEAMEQFGKVIEVFGNSTEILAFIWGPMKFLLVSARSWTDSIDELLETYQHIADSLPIFSGYDNLFRTDRRMQEAPKHVWEVVLDFHLEAVAHLRQKKVVAKQIFRSVWNNFRSRFQHKIDDLQRLKELVDRLAAQLHISHYEADRVSMEIYWAKLFAELAESRKRWINAPVVIGDHEEQIRVREELEKATKKRMGRWILDHKEVQSWLGPDVPRSSIVWIHGVPGAGKSVLASLIIEEVRNQKSAPVAFMYCKYRDPEKNSMLHILRAILAQLFDAHQSDPHLADLSPYYYDEGLTKGGVFLESVKLCKSLLRLILKNIPKAYLVLDGLDECEQDQRKQILEFMIEVTKTCDSQQPGSLRLLIFSRNEPDIRRHLSAETQIAIVPEDVQSDVETYVGYCSQLIKEKHHFLELEREYIAQHIVDGAQGMFLFANLVAKNLLAQPSKFLVTEELRPSRFPKDLGEAHLINSTYMSSLSAEYSMSLLCLQYLTFDCNFDPEYQPALEKVEGQTAFQDYAAAHWTDHVLKTVEVAESEAGTDGTCLPYEDMTDVVNTLRDIYWSDIATISKGFKPPSSNSLSRLGLPETFDIIWEIAQQAKSLRGTGDPDDAIHPSTLEIATKISRGALESKASQSSPHEKRILAEYYGENIFKCPRRTCYYFHEGFKTRKDLKSHSSRHEKPFQFTEPDCDLRAYGFASIKELKKHCGIWHPGIDKLSMSFPRPPKDSQPRKVAELKHVCSFEGCTQAFPRESILRCHARSHALNAQSQRKIAWKLPLPTPYISERK
ncbi:hypothetical protein PspLS_00694 [Pyricularia sp. CBS 133598]|nr:hypothetical protein PspLS_00694 [Pyricularia sp. CBS 133598]